MQKRTALVTGACGFIGSHLVNYLSEFHSDEFRIVMVDNPDAMDLSYFRKNALKDAQFISSEELDRDIKASIGDARKAVLFDLGANSSTDITFRQAYEENVAPMREWAANFKGTLVFASSMSVLGTTMRPASDERSVEINSAYAWSKCQGEVFLQEQAQPGKRIIARLANVYGGNEGHKKKSPFTPDMRSLQFRLLEQLEKDRTVIPTVYKELEGLVLARDFVYVKRAVEALMAAFRVMDKELNCRAGMTIEVGHGMAVSWENAARQCIKAWEYVNECPGSRDLGVLPADKLAATQKPGYQRYTRAVHQGLLRGTPGIYDSCLDMLEKDQESWGQSYEQVILENLTNLVDASVKHKED